jgi:hypothetical protein
MDPMARLDLREESVGAGVTLLEDGAAAVRAGGGSFTRAGGAVG